MPLPYGKMPRHGRKPPAAPAPSEIQINLTERHTLAQLWNNHRLRDDTLRQSAVERIVHRLKHRILGLHWRHETRGQRETWGRHEAPWPPRFEIEGSITIVRCHDTAIGEAGLVRCQLDHVFCEIERDGLGPRVHAGRKEFEAMAVPEFM
jgi:hypothetical protein